VLPLFLAAALVCAVVCGATIGRDGDDPDPNPSGQCGEELTWELDGSALTISGTGAMYDYASSGDNIAPWKNADYPAVETVTIGEGVTTIGDYAFVGCSSLETVDIQGTLTKIGEYAFGGCSSLNSFPTIAVSDVQIGESAFNTGSSVSELIISGSVASIEASAFGSSLTSIKIDGSVAQNGFKTDVFQNCGYSLEKFTVTGSVGTLPSGLFSSLYHLESLSFGSASFSSGLFCSYSCSSYSIKSINLTDPNGVSTINYEAFENLDSLKSFYVAGDIDVLGEDAFSYSGLVDFKVDGSVGTISSSVFSSCTSLKSVTIGSVGTLPSYLFYIPSGSLKTLVFGSVKKFSSCLFCYGSYSSSFSDTVESITVNGDVDEIDDSAFANSYTSSSYSHLTSFTVTGLVGSIGPYAFRGRTGLTSLSLNVNHTIDDFAFMSCTGLTEVSLNAVNLTLGKSVFSGCLSLETLTFSGYVNSIPDYSFYLENLHTLVFDSVGTFGSSLFCTCTNNWYCDPLNYPSYFGCYDSVTSVTIKGDVGVIGDYAFGNPRTAYDYHPSYFEQLTSFTVSGTVGSIGNGAFQGCVSLTELYINGYDDGIIGDYAFYQCWSLTKINVSGIVEGIGDYAFYGCSQLSDVSFEGRVETVGNSAFYGCNSLRSFPFGETIHIIGSKAFYNCSSFTKLLLADLAKEEGNKTLDGDIGSQAFYLCDNINLVFYSGKRDPCREHYLDTPNYRIFDTNVGFERVLVYDGYKDKKFCGAFVKKIATGSAAGLKSQVSLLVGIVLMTVLLTQW